MQPVLIFQHTIAVVEVYLLAKLASQGKTDKKPTMATFFGSAL